MAAGVGEDAERGGGARRGSSLGRSCVAIGLGLGLGEVACGHRDPDRSSVRCPSVHDMDAWRRAVAAERRAAGALVELSAIDLAASSDSTCAIDQEGVLWCWGALDDEALGEAVLATPRAVDLGGPVRAIDGDDAGYCAVLTDGSLACFGRYFDGVVRTKFARSATSVVVDDGDGLVRFDDGIYSTLRSGHVVPGRSITHADGDVVRVAGSRRFRLGPEPRRCGDMRRGRIGCDEAVVERIATAADACERLADGAVRCTGAYARRLVEAGLAAPPPSVFDPFVQVPLAEAAVELVGGHAHMCARTTSGRVYCWGDNWAGQSGMGARGVSVAAARVEGLRDVVAIHGGGATFCALDRAGVLWCWGDAPGEGRPRTGRCQARMSSPVAVGRFAADDALAVDDGSVCALRRGEVRCLGWSSPPPRPGDFWTRWYGRGGVKAISLDDDELCTLRGDAIISCRRDERPCADECAEDAWMVASLVELDGHCARSDGDSVYCWQSYKDELAATFERPLAELRADGRRWCVRGVDRSVWCGTAKGVDTRVVGLEAARIAVGQGLGCAQADGDVYCWPLPGESPWEDREVREVREVTARRIEGIERAVDVALGDEAGCALLGDASVACWGGEGRGELGRGYLAEALEPLVVVHPPRSERAR